MEDTQDLSASVTNLQEMFSSGSTTCNRSWGNRPCFVRRWRRCGPAWTTSVELVSNDWRKPVEFDAETMVVDGQVYRFKQTVDKEWMTLWGKVVMRRRLYQPDRGGASRVPVDERCDMGVPSWCRSWSA